MVVVVVMVVEWMRAARVGGRRRLLADLWPDRLVQVCVRLPLL